MIATISTGCERRDAAPSPSSSETSGGPSAAPIATDLVNAERPQDEAAFIDAVGRAQAAQSNAQNDMQRGGIKADRDAAICKLLASGTIQGWTGRVSKVDANSDGKGVFAVEIAPNIILKTWNNDLSDISDRTLMEPGSQVFKAASRMQTNASVRISGNFFAGSENDCIKEGSLTLRGKLKDPEFIFRFDTVSVLTRSVIAAHVVEKNSVADTVAPSPVSNSPVSSSIDSQGAQGDEVKQSISDVDSVSEQWHSVDCRKANSRVEHLICGTPELTTADANMALAYQAALRQTRDKDALMGFQGDWLKYNRDRCSDVDCLRRSYRERLDNLQDVR
ncbi:MULTISPECIES: lysozyme inhibitor LprI family protein [unclassified Duganella]|uniref:lysozyme inhibitor LprI family protein n=1 Tax=unclassified Duganella TaxID=2636909 RepID=UPI0011C182EC|nr:MULTISPECIES: lysozyme inhibitor LprI family protein [unclassified Duganella]